MVFATAVAASEPTRSATVSSELSEQVMVTSPAKSTKPTNIAFVALGCEYKNALRMLPDKPQIKVCQGSKIRAKKDGIVDYWSERDYASLHSPTILD